jgi:transposase
MTVANWVKRFKDESSVGPREQRHGPLPKLDDKGLEKLRELVEENPDATRGELAERLHRRTGVELSKMGITRALRRLRMPREKKMRSPSEADRPEVWKKLKEAG